MAGVLVIRKGPPPRYSPHHGNQRERGRTKDLMMSRWPLLTLEHVQANDEPRRMGGGETRASLSSNTAMTFAGPTGATGPMSTSPRSVLVGAYLLRLAALPLLLSRGNSVGRSFARSSQRYLRSTT